MSHRLSRRLNNATGQCPVVCPVVPSLFRPTDPLTTFRIHVPHSAKYKRPIRYHCLLLRPTFYSHPRWISHIYCISRISIFKPTSGNLRVCVMRIRELSSGVTITFFLLLSNKRNITHTVLSIILLLVQTVDYGLWPFSSSMAYNKLLTSKLNKTKPTMAASHHRYEQKHTLRNIEQ